jgi:hypothetical protein
MSRLVRIVVSILGTIGSFDLPLLLGAIVLLQTKWDQTCSNRRWPQKPLRVINGNYAILALVSINDFRAPFKSSADDSSSLMKFHWNAETLRKRRQAFSMILQAQKALNKRVLILLRQF